MHCKNCGAQLMDGYRFCSNCGTMNDDNTFSGTTQPAEPVKATGLLIWAIFELLCICSITGIIAIILYCTAFNNAVKFGDTNAALAAKKTMKTVLWVGVGIFGAMILLGLVFALIPTIMMPVN